MEKVVTSALIVGGGITGLCAARLVRSQYDKVTLIEKDEKLGGLYKSEKNKLGHSFDQGTHFVLMTTIPELNQVMLQDLCDDDCYVWTDSLKEGGYFNGKLTLDSGCIDTRALPEELHRKGVVEILNAKPELGIINLEEFLTKNYGVTFTKYVFTPILKKFTGLPLGKLHTNALSNFLITRLLVLDRFGAAQIKHLGLYDQKISWAHRDDGTSEIKKRYPKNNGVGAWVEGIESRILSEGTNICRGQAVAAISIRDREVQSVRLENGETIVSDKIIWTLPPVSFLRLAGVPIENKSPVFRKIVLLHFSIDAMVETDLHWVVCYDPSFFSYRITLYPNITKEDRKPAPHHLTVEVMIDQYQIDELRDKVFRELKTMGLVPESASILDSSHTDIRPGWPIITTEFEQNAESNLQLAKDKASNVTFVGRGKGENAHFLTAVLEDLYNSLQ